jgi:hypothetical protein
VTDEGAPLAAACLHPHPALRATFPRLGEGFCSGKRLLFAKHAPPIFIKPSAVLRMALFFDPFSPILSSLEVFFAWNRP